jgi:signal transduction histidine kinase
MNLQESLFFALFNNIPQGCIIYRLIKDDKGEIVDWVMDEVNQVAASVMGMQPEQLKGASALTLFGKELFAPYLQMSKEVLKTGQSQQHEIFFPISGRHYLSTIYLIDEDHVGNTNFDFTERVLADKQKSELLQQIQQKNEDLEALIHSLSHDLRSPLVNLHGYAKELSETVQQIAAEVPTEHAKDHIAEAHSFIKQIENATKRIDTVSTGLLRYVRLGSFQIDVKCVDVPSIVQLLVHTESNHCKEIGASIDTEALPNCLGDASLISQVLSNLLDNCFKYRFNDIPLKVRISGQIENGWAVYSINDNGIGIPKEQRERVFELFYRSSGNRGVQGDGIGLALVRRAIAQMGGRIWITDGDNGKGTCFQFALPAV